MCRQILELIKLPRTRSASCCYRNLQTTILIRRVLGSEQIESFNFYQINMNDYFVVKNRAMNVDWDSCKGIWSDVDDHKCLIFREWIFRLIRYQEIDSMPEDSHYLIDLDTMEINKIDRISMELIDQGYAVYTNNWLEHLKLCEQFKQRVTEIGEIDRVTKQLWL